jgi:hypothetical protein
MSYYVLKWIATQKILRNTIVANASTIVHTVVARRGALLLRHTRINVTHAIGLVIHPLPIISSPITKMASPTRVLACPR